MSANTIDYNGFKKYRKVHLFLKRSPGAKIPKDFAWECHCGRSNPLTEALEQYCPQCGTRLRLQEQRPDPEGQNDRPGEDNFTIVKVAHFTLRKEA